MTDAPIRKHWFADDPVRTHLFNAFSVSVPESERFFTASAKVARIGLTDRKLIDAADELITEEESHTRVHEAYNTLLKKQGYRIERFEQFEKKVASLLSKRSLKTRLAFCLCGEFFTAVMGRHILGRHMCNERDVDARMSAVWTWHSFEEFGHRGTAYDLYLAHGGGYLRRICAMLFISVFYFLMHAACVSAFIRQDRSRIRWHEWSKGLAFLFGRDGLYTAVLSSVVMFFKLGFHPTKDIRFESGLISKTHDVSVEGHFIETVENSAYA